MITNKLSWSFALAGLAGGSFVLAGVLVPAVSISRAHAQVFAQATPAPGPAVAPAPSVSAVPPAAASVSFAQSAPAPAVAPGPAAAPGISGVLPEPTPVPPSAQPGLPPASAYPPPVPTAQPLQPAAPVFGGF